MHKISTGPNHRFGFKAGRKFHAYAFFSFFTFALHCHFCHYLAPLPPFPVALSAIPHIAYLLLLAILAPSELGKNTNKGFLINIRHRKLFKTEVVLTLKHALQPLALAVVSINVFRADGHALVHSTIVFV